MKLSELWPGLSPHLKEWPGVCGRRRVLSLRPTIVITRILVTIPILGTTLLLLITKTTIKLAIT